MKYRVCGYSYKNDKVVHTLSECETYKKAKMEQEAFYRTRRVEFPVVWIEKLET